MKKCIHQYLDKSGIGNGLFAEMIGVHRNTVRYWLDREEWVASGREGDKQGIRIDPKRWAKIEKVSGGKISIKYLLKLNS